MRVVVAFKAILNGIVNPSKIKEAGLETAMAVFAVAVLLLVGAETASVYLEASDPTLSAQSKLLVAPALKSLDAGSMDISSANRHFTMVMGGSLVKAITSILILSAFSLGFMRFLTNATITQATAITCVSACSGIEILKTCVETPLHLIFHTVRVGPHLGVFVDPQQAPILFSWLQRIDVFNVWYYLAFSIAIAVWGGLHKKYGIVAGTLIYAIVQAVFAFLSLLAGAMSIAV